MDKHKIYRRPEVEIITGLSRSTLYEQIAQNHFPKPVRIGARAVGWRGQDLIDWMNNLATASNLNMHS